ncbi:MAG: putative S-adenosyl-L-methionine-dependent methyltransferase, UbiG-related [Acidimicrobiales bacterium]|nr:putative S-adenosyl-L-methionine-dependent methyltransferase, UbiG-related [Acidimicrobiales bacterium]
MAGARRGTLLEIGCGTGIHLLALAGQFERAVGTDLSAEMIRVAGERAADSPWAERVSFRVDPAEELGTIEDCSVDVVLCVGALEHMLDRAAVLAQVERVLGPGGVVVSLTPNGSYCWYRWLAPLLGRETRHLSTDRFLTPVELTTLLEGAGLEPTPIAYWRFVPRGDLPWGVAPLLRWGDAVGERLGVGWLRGGIAAAAGVSR